MFIVLLLLGLAGLVMAILVLIKQFQNGGAVQGIIGIVTCFIWTFIWGWINAGRLSIRNLMLIWTAVILLRIILGFVFGVSMIPTGMMPGTPAGTP
jgi:hypothetical protein